MERSDHCVETDQDAATPAASDDVESPTSPKESSCAESDNDKVQYTSEELQAYVENEHRWTIFEDIEDEVDHLRRRGDVLAHALRASQIDIARLHEAGAELQDAYQELSAENATLTGDVAYWQELAKAREEELESRHDAVQEATLSGAEDRLISPCNNQNNDSPSSSVRTPLVQRRVTLFREPDDTDDSETPCTPTCVSEVRVHEHSLDSGAGKRDKDDVVSRAPWLEQVPSPARASRIDTTSELNRQSCHLALEKSCDSERNTKDLRSEPQTDALAATQASAREQQPPLPSSVLETATAWTVGSCVSQLLRVFFSLHTLTFHSMIFVGFLACPACISGLGLIALGLSALCALRAAMRLATSVRHCCAWDEAAAASSDG